MRIARVMGKVTANRRIEQFPHGSLLLCEALEVDGARQADRHVPRETPMSDSLVVLDELGAGEGSVIAVSEGREASMPWWPEHRAVDAYCVAILDNIDINDNQAR